MSQYPYNENAVLSDTDKTFASLALDAGQFLGRGSVAECFEDQNLYTGLRNTLLAVGMYGPERVANSGGLGYVEVDMESEVPVITFTQYSGRGVVVTMHQRIATENGMIIAITDRRNRQDVKRLMFATQNDQRGLPQNVSVTSWSESGDGGFGLVTNNVLDLRNA